MGVSRKEHLHEEILENRRISRNCGFSCNWRHLPDPQIFNPDEELEDFDDDDLFEEDEDDTDEVEAFDNDAEIFEDEAKEAPAEEKSGAEPAEKRLKKIPKKK